MECSRVRTTHFDVARQRNFSGIQRWAADRRNPILYTKVSDLLDRSIRVGNLGKTPGREAFNCACRCGKRLDGDRQRVETTQWTSERHRIISQSVAGTDNHLVTQTPGQPKAWSK